MSTDPWKLEPLAGHCVPETQHSDSMRAPWAGLRHWLGRKLAPDEPTRELDHLPPEMVVAVDREPSWSELVKSLESAFDSLEADENLMLVGPPGSGVCDALESWARSRELPVVQAPDTESLLDETRGAELGAGDDETLVLPALHRFYLRHPSGLRTLRGWLEALRGRQGRLVLGCDSWAWEYLVRAVEVGAVLPEPRTPAALDGGALRDWLRGLYDDPAARPFEFRFASNDAPAFTASDESDEYFERLVRSARAVPEVALAMWKNGMRQDRGESESAAKEDGGIVWVDQACESTVLPTGLDRLDSIVLHSLLLHVGLPEGVLHRLLPFDPARVTRSLLALRFTELLCENEGSWTVPPAAYPTVRAFLAREGFLVDAF